MGRVIAWAGAAVLAVVVLIAAAAAAAVSSVFGTAAQDHCRLATAQGSAPVGLSVEQARNAAVIVAVGQRMRVPPRGWVIAVATALQESELINLGHLGPRNDADSLGLFQQRPSQGWGTPEQIMNPEYAARAFYTKLLTLPDWPAMALTHAAQAVQRSATPQAYAKHEARATAIVAATAGGRMICRADGGDGQPGADPVALPPGFTLPLGTPPAVSTAVAWALRQLGTPYSYGGDCTDPHSGNRAHQCDCSSLVQVAYRAAGVTLPRTAAQQSRVGAPVADLADLRPGDLLFIPGADGTPSAPGHVGVYLGDGLLVHAPRTGDNVKISKVSGWAGSISAIRRMVPH